MCVTAILAGAAIVGTIAKVKSDIDSSNAHADAARAQAAIDDENERLANEQALQSERNAEFEAGKIREAGSRLGSKQRLAAVSQNVDPSSGSAAEAQIGSAEVTQEQVDVAKLHGAWEAYGYRSQGMQFGMNAAAHRRAADNYDSALPFTIVGDVATGVGNAGARWWK